MKKIFLTLISFLLASTAFGQARNAGRMVVPIGYESYDSLRYNIFGFDEARAGLLLAGTGPNPAADSLINLYTDSLGCTFHGNWEGWYNFAPLGACKGVMGNWDPNPFFYYTAASYKQRIFWGLPNPQPSPFPEDYYWRFNAAAADNAIHAVVHNITYDANDISPYTEYDANHAIVNTTFHTLRYNNTDSVVTYGNEGRVIAGYNNDRTMSLTTTPGLNWTIPNSTYPQGPVVSGKHLPDTARMFSTTLEFAVDTTSIDTALANGRSLDNLPLARFQVLYKMGDTGTHHEGWNVLPFVPFKDASHLANPGWWKIVDTTITLGIYRNLDNDWRHEDKLANGSVSHSWRFKQLHILLKNMPAAMSALIQNVNVTQDKSWFNFGGGNSDSVFTQYVHPDSLAAYGTNLDTAKKQHLLETRVLSTYRATVFLRDMTYQDTIVDKFLYRRLASGTDSSFGCNPDGTSSGFDDSVRKNLVVMHDSLVAEHHLPFEVLINDQGNAASESWNAWDLGTPMFGYADWLGSEYNIHSHWREQDPSGANCLDFRRARMSLDGQPPSIFENQEETPIASEK